MSTHLSDTRFSQFTLPEPVLTGLNEAGFEAKIRFFKKLKVLAVSITSSTKYYLLKVKTAVIIFIIICVLN